MDAYSYTLEGIRIGEDFEFTIKVNTDDAKSDMRNLEKDRVSLNAEVDKTVKESNAKVDLSFLKAIATVQQIESVVSQVLNMAGLALGDLASSIISTTNQAFAVLVPLFTAQSLSGWQAVQATLGLINLGASASAIPLLLTEVRNKGNWGEMFLRKTNTSLGRNTFNTG